MNPIKIGNQRELFWDDYLVNTSLTGAYLRQHSPRIGDIFMEMDKPWEGDGCDYFAITEDAGIYRMYYLGWEMFDPGMTTHDCRHIRVCVIESKDGVNWYRPELKVRPFEGYETTNIILDEDDGQFDNFHVFIDTNPNCLPEERYKATSACGDKRGLMCWTSPDGYNWTKAWPITDKGYFDTQNVAFWSPEFNKYFCYIRDFHDYESPEWPYRNDGIRDIRYIVSDDFKTWTDPILIDFGGADDVPLYTNAVYRYPRATQMLVGMPSRYVERKVWNNNFDQMPDPEHRQRRIKVSPRYGLTTTDCVLMTSRDGIHWNRYDKEAWMTPGIERHLTWVYGDCYPAVGTIQTPSHLAGAPDELSFYTYDGHWSQQPTKMRRSTVRMDGLFSYRADYAGAKLVTKPLLYEGGQLSINFSTSARGYIYVTAKCGKEAVHSCEIFGDSLDRTIAFDGDLDAFIGKEITLEFNMSDADLYSMQFVK